MAIILLDESYFKEETYHIHKEYFKDLLKFISKYFELDIAIFIPDANIGEVWSANNLVSKINIEIQKTGQFELFDSNIIEDIVNSDFDLLEVSDLFVGKIDYLYKHGHNNIIIPLSPDKHYMEIKRITDYVFIVNHIYRELDSNISNWISDNMYMKNITIPTLKNPLPNTDLCHEYKSVQDRLIQGQDTYSRIPIYLKVGGEVLRRNTYIFNAVLSSINTTKKKIREIYKTCIEEVVHGSIDVESGSIEICDENGRHKDEYGYDNQSHDKHDSTGKHDIKLHK